MKLKMSEDGKHAVVKDGLPVYVAEDGAEKTYDPVAMHATISRLNGEAKTHRERAERAEAAAAAFEGITDPAAARKAMETVANLDAKKLIDAGEAERVRGEAIKAVEAKYAPVVREVETLKGQLHAEIVGGAFARSKFIGEKLILPPDVAQAYFGKHFTVKDGKLVAVDAAGNAVVSHANPGEMADFDEALSLFVSAYPQPGAIMKGTGASGGGAQGSGGGGAGGVRTVTRAQFDAMTPAEQAATGRDAAAGKVKVTD